MAQVSVTIDNRKYRLACNEGEEARLRESLAGVIDKKIGELRRCFRRDRRPAARRHGCAHDRGQPRRGARRGRGRARPNENRRGASHDRRRGGRPTQFEDRVSGCAARRRRGDLNLRKSRRALIALAVDLSWGWRAFDFTASWPGLSRPSTRLCFCEAGRLPANKKISSHQLSHTAHGKVGLIK